MNDMCYVLVAVEPAVPDGCLQGCHEVDRRHGLLQDRILSSRL